jgi:hypothetical protein
MPKDATKNVDRYKVRGGQLNEFEYDQNQAALAEQKPKTNQAKGTKTAPPKGASAKKLAARKAAKK